MTFPPLGICQALLSASILASPPDAAQSLHQVAAARAIAQEIPVLDENLCTQCGKCPLVCPHGVIRSKVFDEGLLSEASDSFKSMPVKGKDFPQGLRMSYQVAPEDCTGCTQCVDVCPVKNKSQPKFKVININVHRLLILVSGIE